MFKTIIFLVIISKNVFSDEPLPSPLVFLPNKTKSEKKYEAWSIGFSKSILIHNVANYFNSSNSIAQDFLGFSFGKKFSSDFFNRPAIGELLINYSSFENTAISREGTTQIQNAKMLKLDFFENFLISQKYMKNISFFWGLGISPVYFSLDSSSLNSSKDEIGLLINGKLNFVYPVEKKLSSILQIKNISLSPYLFWGPVAGESFFGTGMTLGFDYE